jgi:hypothetical protein
MSDISTSAIRAAAPSERHARIDATFTPASPVTRRDLFAGRIQALQQLIELAAQPGRHAVVFGERSIGKTSLATIVPEFCDGPVGLVCVTAEAGDTFTTLWRRAAESVRTTLRRAERGLASSPYPSDTPTTLGRDTDATVTGATALLARLSAASPVWIVFDAFERVTDVATRTQMRELAEATETAAPRATLVYTGQAQAGDELLEPSTSLVPVRVSRFTNDESVECVMRSLRAANIAADDVVVERIAVVANGLPHAVQALTRAAAHDAASAGSGHLESLNLDAAMRAVLTGSPEEVRLGYEQATVRARRGIYPEILLACALAPRDEYGSFSVANVCEAVTRIVHREVRGLTNQVSALTEAGRGSVLDKQGAAKAARYRFVDPRLEPYILMRGLEEGWATHDAGTWLPGLAESQAETEEMRQAA